MNKVKINSDSFNEIAGLYGIGSVLAKRIVDYREANGYFTSPDDLAKVEGVSQELSLTLSPQIDWQIPGDPSQKKNRDYVGFFAMLMTVVLSSYFIYARRIPDLMIRFENYSLGTPRNLIWAFIQLNLFLFHFFMTVAVFDLAICAITTDTKLYRKVLRLLIILLVLALVSIILVVILNIIYYQFISPWGWQYFFNRTNLISSLIAAEFGSCILFMVISLWKPIVLSKKWFERVLNLAFVFIGIAIFVTGFSSTQYFSVWFSTISFVGGILFVFLGWLNIKEGYFLTFAIIEVLQILGKNIAGDVSFDWQTWINTRLPNPDDQKALRDALNKSYPPSTTRSLFGIFFISIGGWLVITTLSSIIEWFVQRFLNSWLP